VQLSKTILAPSASSSIRFAQIRQISESPAQPGTSTRTDNPGFLHCPFLNGQLTVSSRHTTPFSSSFDSSLADRSYILGKLGASYVPLSPVKSIRPFPSHDTWKSNIGQCRFVDGFRWRSKSALLALAATHDIKRTVRKLSNKYENLLLIISIEAIVHWMMGVMTVQ
jgi:hypothetical protein